ncbi:MlaD family protein, partial [Desulfurella sp.]|uniref:MlaD family protein n=1 Tax=Desulfurella sp. TaxID=1962857 RepID=UPI0025B93941
MNINKETKVGIFVVIVIAILAYFSFKVGKIHIFKSPTYVISAYFKSASGIGVGTSVTMAGIKIGSVKKISLENGLARVYMTIKSKYKVYPQYIASIRSLSLLGESYIAISPASGERPEQHEKNLNNEVVRSEMSPQSMSALITKFSKTAGDLEKVSKSLKNSIGTKTGEKNIKAILHNIAMLSENLNRLVYINQRNVDIILSNFAAISRHINGLTVQNDAAITRTIHNFNAISYNLRKELPSITHNIKGLSKNLNYIVAKNRKNINGSLRNINADTKKLKLTLNELYGISSKINNGQGTIGKLVNRNSVYDNLNGSLKGINNIVGGYSRFKVKVNMNSQYLVRSKGSVSQVNIKLEPSPGHYYELGVASVPMGYGNTYGETQTTTYTTNNPPSGQFYPSSVTTNTTQYSYSNSIKFNALIAKNFYNFTLLAGLLYSTGAVGVNYYVPDTGKNLKIYARAFGFNSDNNGVSEDINAGVAYTFYRHIFLDAGYDNITDNSQRSIYLGGGIKFTDKDLKYLIVGG